jgi:hypothetical protein
LKPTRLRLPVGNSQSWLTVGACAIAPSALSCDLVKAECQPLRPCPGGFGVILQRSW